MRDNMATSPMDLVQRGHNYAIVDEVDSVLIDDARTPLIISGPVPKGEDQMYDEYKHRVELLVRTQNTLTTKLLAEAKAKMGSVDEKEREAGELALFRCYKGMPKSKALIKYLSEPGVKVRLQKTEEFYMQENEKNMHIATDELYFETKNEVPLLKFDVSEIPDFEGRTTNYSLVFERTQGQVAARMNMYACWPGGYTIYDGRVWPLWIHSARVLVPYNLYPELYEASGGTQVCVTSEKAVATWLENLKKVIEENPGGINFGIGLEDSASHCTCITCKTEAAEHGGYGGVMMRFLNKLSDMLDPWMQEVFPGREIRLVGLAYHAWLEAPIKEDANGNIVPYDDTVLPRENVGVMYAPDSACYGCAMDDPNCSTNVAFARHLNNWSAVCDKLTVYSYCTNFYNYFINFNNWGAMQENYRFFKECGVYYVYDQGAPETYNPMQALRVYLTSRLLWDVEQNVDDLIDDFMAHYYKAGAQYIRKYYDLTRAHYARLAEDGIWTNINIGVVGDRASSKEWPYAYCTQAMKCFDDAKKAVQESNLDTETKEKVLLRIDRDSTAVRYLILQNYSDKYSKTDWNAMVEEFSSICTLGNIRICAEWGTPVSDLINQWRKL